MMKKERDNGGRQSLAGLHGSSSPGFSSELSEISSGLGGARRDLVKAGGACRGLAGLPGSSSGLVKILAEGR